MTIYRATVLDTPGPAAFPGTSLRALADAGLRVADETIVGRGEFAALRAAHPGEDVVDLREGILLPGLVDTHVHFPQVRIIGGLGMPLLQWLERRALPEEIRLGSLDYARGVAADFAQGLVSAGTTTALVFGSHFPAAMDVLFETTAAVGLRITSGLVVADRSLPEPLLTTPERAYAQALDLAGRWHGVGRTRYAVTPRFSYAATDELLDACGSVLKDVDGLWCTSHVNENPAEIAAVTSRFAGLPYVATYDRHGLVGGRTVLAHNVHPIDPELDLLAARGAAVAHCPTSNAVLGSGLFPFRRHVEHGVRVALGSDVGAGTGFSLVKEALQAHVTQRILGAAGVPLTAPDLLHLATRSGAAALGLDAQVGDLGEGKAFDAIWISPRSGDPLDVCLRHAESAEDALAACITLGTPSDVRGVWVAGTRIDTAAQLNRPSAPEPRC